MPEIAAGYFHGSAARGVATTLSDVDAAVLFRPGVASDDRPLLISRFAASVAKKLPGLPLDVADIEDLPLVIQGRILTDGILIGSNDDVQRVAFETSTRLRYFDFLPFHQADVSEGLRALRRRHLGG